jgi:uncharacterized membrane protein
MTFLPDWAPNLHPLLIHFPIALLTTATLIDFGRLVFGRLNPAGVGIVNGLYAAGTALLAATYVSGRNAAMTVFIPGMAHGAVDEHWTLAAWCLAYFAVVTVGRVAMRRPLKDGGRGTAFGFVLAGLVGLALLTETAEHGGRLVYEYGVGVAAAPIERALP